MAQYVALSATTQVKIGAGKLIGIVISSTSSGTLKIYDSKKSDTNDPVIIDTITPAAGGVLYFGPNGIYFSNGLYMVEGGTLVWTVIFE